MLTEWLPDTDLVVRYRRFMYEFENQRNVQIGLRLFLAGTALAIVALVLFLWAYTFASPDSYYTWVEGAYALSLLALPLVVLSIVVLLRPGRRMLKVGVAGVAITALAAIGFVWAYPDDWYHHGADYTVYVVSAYAIGMGGLTVAMGASLKAHAPQLIRTLTEIRPPDSYEPSTDARGSPETAPDSTDTGDDPSPSDGRTNIAGSERSGSNSGPDSDVPSTVTLIVNGERYAFGDGDTFGRRDEPWLNDLMTACGGHEEVPYVSGEHIEFAVKADGVYVSDLSRNGTALNGRDLDGGEAKLSDGDTLVLAERAEIDVEL